MMAVIFLPLPPAANPTNHKGRGRGGEERGGEHKSPYVQDGSVGGGIERRARKEIPQLREPLWD